MDTRLLTYLILATFGLIAALIPQRPRSDYRQLPNAPLTYAEYPSYNIIDPNGPGTYAFGYEIEDPSSGNVQFRDEERLANGTVRGSYGHLRPDGKLTVTRFWADARGYRSETQTYDRIENPSHPQSGNSPIDNNYDQPSLSPQEVEQILLDQQIDLRPLDKPADDPNIPDLNDGNLLGDKKPILLQSRDSKGRFSVQFVNNFIPSNFPIVTFESPFSAVAIPPQMPEPEEEDPIDPTNIVNDKFHDPIFDERRQQVTRRKPNIFRRPVISKVPKQDNMLMASTKEALWFKDMIRNRRKEYLQKYSANYDSYTIPANYVVDTKKRRY